MSQILPSSSGMPWVGGLCVLEAVGEGIAEAVGERGEFGMAFIIN